MGALFVRGALVQGRGANSLGSNPVLNQCRWRTRDELHTAVVHWGEHTYDIRRRERRLGKLTPGEFELAFTRQAATAKWSNSNGVNRT